MITDSAFKKEEQTGHSLKGTLLLRVPDTRTDISTGKFKCHLFDFNTKRISNVTRSTFSAELFGLCDACDHAMFLRQIIHEFIYGPLSAEAGRQLREGSLQTTVHIEIAIDAMSVFSAVTADRVKAPAEKSLLSHIQFVRELLDKGIVRALMWLDTRDMTADVMTKGSVDRKAIEDCMSGSITFQHDLKRWEPLLRKHIKPFFILATNQLLHTYSRAAKLLDDGTRAKQEVSFCDL